MRTCFFVGHSDAPEDIREKLFEGIIRCVKLGITNFIVGQYGAFDLMAAGAVKRAKQKYTEIALYLLLPYHPAERPMVTPEGFDGTVYPFERSVSKRIAIIKANQIMIDSSEYLICYVKHPGNSKKLLEYAKKRNNDIEIVNLATENQKASFGK